MNTRYYFEINDGPSPYYCFAYFDTDEHLADFLFAHEGIDVRIEGEFFEDDDPYRIIMCRIPKKDRAGFMRAIGQLPDFMAYMGKPDYDEFCREFMKKVARYMAHKEAAGRRFPLQ